MNILVVNDDGIEAYGLKMLAKALSKYGTVYVCAPDKGRSAASHSIDLKNPIYLNLVEFEYAEKAYSLSSTPVDCIRVFTGALDVKIDVVFSGINDGLNVGTDIIYSGTVAAAREAMIEGYKSVAISCDRGCWDKIEPELDDLLAYIFDKDLLSKEYTLNINYPTKENDKVIGIKICKQGKKRFKSYFSRNADNSCVISHENIYYDEDQETDVYLGRLGYTTIVPIFVNQTNFDALSQLKEKYNAK